MIVDKQAKYLNSVPGSIPISCSARAVATGIVATISCLSPAARAQQLRLAPASPGPDTRYKADILSVVAHPDEETMVTTYLAKAVLDEHKRVAVIYGPRGNGGGNAEGYEQAAALGAEREIEGRRALAFLDVMNV